MKKYSSHIFLAAFFLFLILSKFHSLYAGTKYLGEDWDAFSGGTSDIICKGHFDLPNADDNDVNEQHWVTRYGVRLKNTNYEVTTITAGASPRAIELDNSDSICYVSGGIDTDSWSAINGLQKADFLSVWGEGDHIMSNYTHFGLYIYNETPSSAGGNVVNILLKEADLVDTEWLSSGTYYYDKDEADTFPGGFYLDENVPLAGRSNDGDATADVELEVWLSSIQKDWLGWKFFLLRLGNSAGSGQDENGAREYYGEDPEGDFDLLGGGKGDQRFNIREVYNAVGNPDVTIGDDGDSYVIDQGAAPNTYEDELDNHFGTTLPVLDSWVRGDVEGLKWIEVHNAGAGKIYIDNLMFTKPLANGAAAATGTARVDYSWISDSIQTTLYDTADTPLSKYWHDSDNAEVADVNMATHYGSLWYDITGFIPPTFSAVLDGDASETMSRISIVSQADYTTLLNTSNQPYFYGNGTVGTTSPNNGADGIFQSPNVGTPPISYATWYTMFVTPRVADGNDTTSSVGYPQVVNFRFTKPTTKMKVLQSEELTN